MAGMLKTFSHKLKPKQIHGMCGLDGPTGKPGAQRPAAKGLRQRYTA